MDLRENRLICVAPPLIKKRYENVFDAKHSPAQAQLSYRSVTAASDFSEVWVPRPM